MRNGQIAPTEAQMELGGMPVEYGQPSPLDRALAYPQLRFMGSKFRLLPWIYFVLKDLPFQTALDAFSGSGCVGYLMKAMDKTVTANDFLRFSSVVAQATIANSRVTLPEETIKQLVEAPGGDRHFIEETFHGIFFTPADLKFLDRVWWNIQTLRTANERAIALAALIRSCVKRQPRGVFTVAGDPPHYKDGRRDLRLSLRAHFLEQVRVFNRAVFDNDRPNQAQCEDVFHLDPRGYDLVYMDPPYVPRADDNCYVKRYHFLEGLVCYWQDVEILQESRVKKIRKPYTPFSYRRDAEDAFDRLFALFSGSILVLSYSSNGYPDLPILVRLMRRQKRKVEVYRTPHQYFFGTHRAVERDKVQEYLVVGS